MNKKINKLLSLMLSVILVLSISPAVFAEGSTPTDMKVDVYTGTADIAQGTLPESSAKTEITLTPEEGKYSFNIAAVKNELPQSNSLLSGWKLWSTDNTGSAAAFEEYALSALLTADELTNSETGFNKILEPVRGSVCEITEQPTVAKPTVTVSNASQASFAWWTATVAETVVTPTAAIDGQTTATLTQTPEENKSYVCKITWTGDAGDTVELTSAPVTYSNVTITFDSNGGTGTMNPATVLSGTKYELPECDFTAPENKVFTGWTIDGTVYAPEDEVTVCENTTVSASWAEKVATPSISPTVTTIYSTTTISISCATSGAEIYYTVDNSTPTTASTKYTGAFLAKQNPTTVKAIAVKAGMADSEIASKQYVVNVYTSLGGGSISSGGGYGGTSTSSYTVKFDTNGGLTIASQYVKKNGYATEPENPTKYGYRFKGWYTDKGLTKAYDFDTKVTSSFTLYAKWESENSTPADTNNNGNTAIGSNNSNNSNNSSIFADVANDSWYAEAVKYAFEEGLINGMSETEFGPAVPLNRAMLVTVLYRADGSPSNAGTSAFADVESGAYYANAVAWAAQNNIVNGMSEGEFAPTLLITREQFATILYRYAIFKGYISADTAFAEVSAPDSSSVSEYAKQAIAYCIESGIITGYEDQTIAPKGNTTRAEAAAMLRRFMEASK